MSTLIPARHRWSRRLGAWLSTAALVLLVSPAGIAATHIVEAQDVNFTPRELTIAVGDTVRWLQVDVGEHTVTSDDKLFDSGTLFSGEEFSYTFRSVGTFRYYCDFHGFPGGGGYSGVVFVAAAGENRSPAIPVNQSPTNGASNQALTPQLRSSAFSDPDASDFHSASQWRVRRASDSAVVFDSGEDPTNRTTLTLRAGLLASGTTYNWQVRHKDGRGAWSEYSPATTFTTLVPTLAQGVGLRATFFNDTALAAPLAVATNSSIQFDWGKTRPHRRITADHFGVRWEGSILPEFTASYQIQFQYRGRARVWVNSLLLIDEWNDNPFSQTRRGAIDLVGGQLAAVRVEYVAHPSGAQAYLRWTSPSLSMEPVPTSRLFPPNP